ncbi:MAG: helix-hairpin-helix domain-containing protein [Bacteroidia bacterium]|nr:helix-hairpin-helix domain-containing protein [Bacteroidia bacterium]
MLKYLKQYFLFTKRERIGTYILILLIMAVLAFRFTISHQTVDQSATIEEFKKEIADFEASQKEKPGSTFNTKTAQTKKPTATKQITYFKFNPNDINIDDWVRLGLSEKQATSIINYKSKGGKFRTKLDVKKMYTISEKKYLELEPYIELPERFIASSSNTKKEIFGDSIQSKPKLDVLPSADAPLELNITSAYKLTTTLNVNQVLAASIIKYRNYLNGFIDINQLYEVEGMDSTTFSQLSPYLKVNSKYVSKININTDNSRDLWHPYISKSLQKNIFNYRRIHGDYERLEDLKKLALITDEIYRKLVPYLTVD